MVTDIDLENLTEYVEKINVYNDGEILCYGKRDDKFDKICVAWQDMLSSSRQMPAYGVSLHGETVKALKEGVWVEFGFDKSYSNSGMPFEKLLVSVVPEFTGFNIIRYNKKAGYDGRCFYFDLVNNDMSQLYDCLVK